MHVYLVLFLCMVVFPLVVVRFNSVPTLKLPAGVDAYSNLNVYAPKYDFFNDSALRNNLLLSNSSLETLSEKARIKSNGYFYIFLVRKFDKISMLHDMSRFFCF
jgi:hypothetical protein